MLKNILFAFALSLGAASFVAGQAGTISRAPFSGRAIIPSSGGFSNCAVILGADGGQYFAQCNGQLWLNSNTLNFSTGGTGQFKMFPNADGKLTLTNTGNTAGVGFDVTSDGNIKIQNRSFTTGTGSVISGGFTMVGGNLIGQTAATVAKWGIGPAGTVNGLVTFTDGSGATGQEFNVNGGPTLGTCTGGTITSGSHAQGGEVTGTTGGSCVINFNTSWTNAPFCTATDESATPTALQLSARSVSSITVANITSGHSFNYICVGRIGT